MIVIGYGVFVLWVGCGIKWIGGVVYGYIISFWGNCRRM